MAMQINLLFSCAHCNPVNVKNDLRLIVQCEGCQTIVWLMEDTSAVSVSVFTYIYIILYIYTGDILYCILKL